MADQEDQTTTPTDGTTTKKVRTDPRYGCKLCPDHIPFNRLKWKGKRNQSSSLEYHINTEHPESAKDWETLKVVLPYQEVNPRKNQRYECLLCDDGKQFRRISKGISAGLTANTCLELHVDAVHPLWVENWLVLKQKSSLPYQSDEVVGR